MYCWGNGRLQPTLVDASTGYVKIVAGFDHFCRLDASGQMSCFEYPNHGFNPDFTATVPVADMTAGLYHTCARSYGGKVICWGLNGGWQPGAAVEGYGPVEVAGQPTEPLPVATETSSGLHPSWRRD